VAAHAALGCAAGAAAGSNCESGAIGGATGAVVSPLVGNALGIETNADRANPLNQVVVTALAMLTAGTLAGALGQNALGATGAAQNEALNNYLSAKQQKGLVDSLKACASGDAKCVQDVTANYASVNADQQKAAQNCTGDNCMAIANDARVPSINSADNLAACQGVAACVSLLNSLPAQNSTAAFTATNRWNSTSNASAQAKVQQALLASGASPTTAAAIAAVSPVDISGTVDAALGAVVGSLGSRPSWRQSENDVGTDLGSSARSQISYKNGVEVPNGTPGSVRPDFVGTNGGASFEVKNYNIATNTSGLINNVAQQAIQRASNLPDGMQQQVIIDIRGQTVSLQQETAIRQGIVQKSNGAISPNSIQFKR
jgi:filamentous hemagglutinin